MKTLKVRVTFIEDVLGTANADSAVHERWIASNAPDAKTLEEEIEAVGVAEVEEKSMTIFPRNDEGDPIFWDYQWKGFFKEACSMLKKCPGEDFAKESLKIKSHKKVVDGLIFVYPRKIKIDLNGGETGDLQRPLRAATAQGERVALARSETVPAGSSCDITITCLSDGYMKAVKEWLDYGLFKGMGQWRNASYGRFTYQILSEE